MKFEIVEKFYKLKITVYDFSTINIIKRRNNVQYIFYFSQSAATDYTHTHTLQIRINQSQ